MIWFQINQMVNQDITAILAIKKDKSELLVIFWITEKIVS